jgi:hypothetical protein
MELERFIRDSESEWENVIDAIQQTFIIIPASIPQVRLNQPLRIKLFPNYPNPFNPNTYIRFNLPQSAFLQLQVYDMSGQLVRQLVSGFASAGNYVYQWDGRDDRSISLSSGTYIVTLKAEGRHFQQKIQLIK